MKKADYYKRALKVFEELHKDYPHYEMGRHIDTAFADYGNMWGMTGKEFLFALEKYQSELAMDEQQLVPEDYVNKIVEDARDFDHILDEKEEEED